MLPDYDEAFLNDRYPGWSMTTEGGMTCLTIPIKLPSGFTLKTTELLLRVPPGYPDIAPDMWWFHPSVERADGSSIPCTQSMETYLGRVWQRWSRHLLPGQWQSGIDSLESYLSLVHSELRSAGRSLAA